jgi:hypothetical protein
MANEMSITLPAEVVECALALAKEQNCTVGELVREALCRHQEQGQLLDALASGRDHSDAVDDFIQEYVDRMIHENRAEWRALSEAAAGKEAPQP